MGEEHRRRSARVGACIARGASVSRKVPWLDHLHLIDLGATTQSTQSGVRCGQSRSDSVHAHASRAACSQTHSRERDRTRFDRVSRRKLGAQEDDRSKTLQCDTQSRALRASRHAAGNRERRAVPRERCSELGHRSDDRRRWWSDAGVRSQALATARVHVQFVGSAWRFVEVAADMAVFADHGCF